jgi:hypothetical protein
MFAPKVLKSKDRVEYHKWKDQEIEYNNHRVGPLLRSQ